MTEIKENIKIHQFLDTLFQSNLTLTTDDCQTIQDQAAEVYESIKLTKHVVIKDESDAEQKHHKTFPDLMNEKHSKEIYSSEDELRKICKRIALTSDWILSKKEDYPWPHPKNVRYVDHYVQTVPLSGRKGMKPIVRCQDVPVNCQKILTNDFIRKCNVNSEKREASDECLKTRKQNRSRGKKKKKHS